MKNGPLISIVIPALNSEKTLERCLKSIIGQSYRNYEIIIVDGGSEDRTTEIAERFNTKIIDANVRNISIQTNIGIANSKGDYIYRVDSDCILPSNILETAILKCENERYDGVCIFWLPDESISFWAKVRKIEKESYCENPNYVGSIKYDKNVLGARFLRRDVIDSVGRFNEGVPTFGEDYEIYNKLARSNFKFAVIEMQEKHIGEPRTIKDVISKNFNYGRSMRTFLREEKYKKGIQQFSPVGRKYLINAFKKALRQDITLFLGLTIYLFIVYASAFIGYASTLK